MAFDSVETRSRGSPYGVRQIELARAWGCTRQHVYRVEASRRPTPHAIARYLAALAVAASHD